MTLVYYKPSETLNALYCRDGQINIGLEWHDGRTRQVSGMFDDVKATLEVLENGEDGKKIARINVDRKPNPT